MVQKVKINVLARFSDGQLDLSMSDLDEVPVKEIAALKKTHSLDLSNNRLAWLPSTFSCLSFLTKLDLSKNELTELPEDFGSLSKLRYLDLYKNNLERLPLSFSQLGGLKFLDLKDNPLIPTIAKVAGPCLDNKGCQQCAKDVVKFFKQLEHEVETRKQIRQKQVEINQQKKQAEKRRLKKERQSKTTKDIELAEDNVPDLPSCVTAKIREKEIIKACPASTKHSLFALFVYFVFLCTLVLWFLFSWRIAWTRKLAPEIYNYYKIILDKLPHTLKAFAQYFGDSVISLQLGTRNLSQQCANIVYNSEIVQTLLTKIYGLIGENIS